VKSRYAACVFALCAALVAAPSVARASTINFAGLTGSGTPNSAFGGLEYFGSSLTYQGFTFTSSYPIGFGLTIWETASPNHPTGGSATTSLLEYVATSTTTIARANAAPFELNAIDLANWGAFQSFPATFSVTFTGTKSNLSTVTQTFVVNNGPSGNSPTLQNFVFNNTFTDLVSVQMTQGTYAAGTAFQFNNLVVDSSASTPVPEPGTLLLMAGGLAMVRGLRSRLRK